MIIFGLSSKAKQEEHWSWTYRKIFSDDEKFWNIGKKNLTFEKTETPDFSQLIFSWNAFRPKEGYFSFFIQSKSQNNGWGQWHKMFDWGADIQKSYFSKSDFTNYVYVRLESCLGAMLNAFRIKIESHKGADLGLLASFTVCITNFKKFKNQKIDHKLSFLPSIHIKNVPKQSQRTLDHPDSACLCSPTSCSMLTGFLTQTFVDPISFAAGAFDYGLQEYGSWPFNVAHAFERCDGEVVFSTVRMNSFSDLHESLMNGIPIVVSVRGYLQHAPKEYNNGHLLIVVGWDANKKNIICHDPAFYTDKSTEVKYLLGPFLRAWEKSHRLTYVAEPLRKSVK